MSYPDFLLDKRVLQRNIAKGLVEKKAFDEHLAALPDVEDNAEACAPEEPEEKAEGADEGAAEEAGAKEEG
jgi:hypothetical protein